MRTNSTDLPLLKQILASRNAGGISTPTSTNLLFADPITHDTCLHVAAKHNNAALLGFLLTLPPFASPSSSFVLPLNRNNESPLHSAVRASSTACVKTLLSHLSPSSTATLAADSSAPSSLSGSESTAASVVSPSPAPVVIPTPSVTSASSVLLRALSQRNRIQQNPLLLALSLLAALPAPASASAPDASRSALVSIIRALLTAAATTTSSSSTSTRSIDELFESDHRNNNVLHYAARVQPQATAEEILTLLLPSNNPSSGTARVAEKAVISLLNAKNDEGLLPEQVAASCHNDTLMLRLAAKPGVIADL